MLYNKSLLESIAEKLIAKKSTIAVAESVTSGHLQAAFSYATNAPLFFQGGITTYNVGQQCKHLMIEPTHAIACNCVSEKIAEEMATHASSLFLSDYGIGITGYAVPMPETGTQQLFAYIAVAFKEFVILSEKLTSAPSDSVAVQLLYANKALEHLNDIL